MKGLLPAGVAMAMAFIAPCAYAEDGPSALQIVTTKCPGGTQGAAYAGCTIVATGGTPPYTFSFDTTDSYPPLPEGLSIDAASGLVGGAEIGGQGTYDPRIIVTDSTKAQASRQIAFAIDGANTFLAKIFPTNSIFHHRVDNATTGLPVDTSPAAPIYSGYLFGDREALFRHLVRFVSERNSRVLRSVQSTRRAGVDDGVPVLFHLGADSGERAGGRHEPVDGRSACADLSLERPGDSSGAL
jgi:hypothetical protein